VTLLPILIVKSHETKTGARGKAQRTVDKSPETSTPSEVPELSFGENLTYNLTHALPTVLRGLFTRNAFWQMLWSRYHPDPLAIRFVKRIRQKYRSNHIYINLFGKRSLLVLDPATIQKVLDNSPTHYADSKMKRTGMAHFQPNALTISRGEEWQDRRRFNEAVLESGNTIHRYAEQFHNTIRQEIATSFGDKTTLQWADFERCYERIAQQIIFGKQDSEISSNLDRLMRQSNRVFLLRHSSHFDNLYQGIRAHLATPNAHSLASLAASQPTTPHTCVENQIPHWLFALKDTLVENVVPALALIVAYPTVEQRVRQELSGVDLTKPEQIGQLNYLSGCVQEAMRLWPTTSILTRECIENDTLAGIPVERGMQIVILNSFTHRDETLHADANLLCPERWLNGHDSYAFNHLSHGPQVCAGKELALFVACAFLATLLSERTITLHSPLISPLRPVPETFDPFRATFSSQPLYAAG
jgi:cytochrome P450